MSDKRLTLVPDPEASVTQADVDHLNMDKLRDIMNRGTYALEAAIFSQTVFELNRLGKTREMMNLIGDELLTPQILEQLDPASKLKLYEMMNRNMNLSLQFLQNLHNNLTTSTDAAKRLEKEKSSQITKVEDHNDGKLDKVREMILAKIKERTST